MSNKPPVPPNRKSGPRRNNKMKLNLSAIKTLVESGYTLNEISVTIGKSPHYLSIRAKDDTELASVIDEAMQDRDSGIDYDMIEQLAAQGNTQQQISAAMGYGLYWIDKRKKHDEKLVDALERGKAKGVVKVTNALFQNAVNGNLGAQCFYLKNRAGWRDRFDIDANTTHQHFYMEGRPESESIESWQQQFSPTKTKQTVQ